MAESIERFLDYINDNSQKEDRAFLAAMRRGLSDGLLQEASWKYVIPWCGDNFDKADIRTIWCVIGGSAALLYPEHLVSQESKRNWGDVMREFAMEGNDGDTAKMEPQFRRMLNCKDRLELCKWLVKGVRFAVQKGVSVNLVSLYWDLITWDTPERRDKTRIHWSQHFYQTNGDTKQTGEE